MYNIIPCVNSLLRPSSAGLVHLKGCILLWDIYFKFNINRHTLKYGDLGCNP